MLDMMIHFLFSITFGTGEFQFNGPLDIGKLDIWIFGVVTATKPGIQYVIIGWWTVGASMVTCAHISPFTVY
jgi:hypothetical protein